MDAFTTLSSFFSNAPVLKEMSEDEEIETSLPPQDEETNSKGGSHPAYCVIA
ncbi:hypothetical protein P691DRAFT_800645 [Macrolepiota fuliginosa MF-IS2]|uniref:Pheromone n=1 Tax=Macrolepiota fuliginosa MF-IS2 TaxID=1400762 RepID=A0A9P5XDW5_9AGAR|nr:hypothetical protein P691DRAFT_800645 [Macrolepiota fuliginosa MF-IS2]